MKDRSLFSRPELPDPGKVVARLRDQYWSYLGSAPDEPLQGEVVPVLGFRLDEQRYVLELGACDCVVRVPRLVRLPRCPKVLLGAFGLRGEVIPILALRRTLGLAERAPGPRSRLIVVRAEGQVAGILADRVDTISEVPGPWGPPGSEVLVIEPPDAGAPDAIHRLSVRPLLRRALAEVRPAQAAAGDTP